MKIKFLSILKNIINNIRAKVVTPKIKNNMFIPKLFRENDIEKTRAFIEKNSFGILVSQTNQQLSATHIPLMLDKNENGKDVLQGHISKANPQWQAFMTEAEVLAIFSGPHTYISSSWYANENVSTWNYVAVHIYGKIRALEGQRLIAHLSKLTSKYEAASASPRLVENMSPDYLAREMKGLIGFEIEIMDIQAAQKMSQNRNEADYQNIITELEQRNEADDSAVAQIMKQNRNL